MQITEYTSAPTPSSQLQPSRPNKTTQACLDYLLSKDESRRSDAFKHLVAILMTATKNLYIPTQEIDQGENSRKYDFAIEFLLNTLSPYQGMEPELIRVAALEDKFRFLGKRFRCRVINQIRDVTKAATKRSFEIYTDGWQTHSPDNEGSQTNAGRTPRLGPDQFDELLAECDFLSETHVQTAVILFDLSVDDLWEESTKGERTEALAARLGITVQAARKRIQQLRKAFANAIRSGHQGAISLADRLASHVIPATYSPRNTNFWSVAANPANPKCFADENPGSIHPLGENGEPIQFDSSDNYFGYHQYQDMKALERGFDEVGIYESARGYSWNQKSPYPVSYTHLTLPTICSV